MALPIDLNAIQSDQIQKSPITLNNTDIEEEFDHVLLTGLNSVKDRIFLLKLDKDLENFINDKNISKLEFQNLNGYYRLFVHRLAHIYKLSHIVDFERQAVILFKNIESSIPKIRLADIKKPDNLSDENQPQGLKIMKRGSNNKEAQVKPTRSSQSRSKKEERKAMNLEEKEAAYQLARARIFQKMGGESDSTGASDPELNKTKEIEEATMDYFDADIDSSIRVQDINQTQPLSKEVNSINHNQFNNQPMQSPSAYSHTGTDNSDSSGAKRDIYDNESNFYSQVSKPPLNTAPYQQFQVNFQQGYNMPPLGAFHPQDPAGYYYSGPNAIHSPRPPVNSYGTNNYAMNPNTANMHTTYMGPEPSYRPPPKNRELFDPNRPSRSNQRGGGQSDMNKLTQSFNQLRMHNGPSPTFQTSPGQTRPQRPQVTLQILSKIPDEPLRNIYIRGATIRRLPHDRNVLLASFESEEAAEHAMREKATDPMSRIVLTRWDARNSASKSPSASSRTTSPQLASRVTADMTSPSNQSVRAI